MRTKHEITTIYSLHYKIGCYRNGFRSKGVKDPKTLTKLVWFEAAFSAAGLSNFEHFYFIIDDNFFEAKAIFIEARANNI